jgi:hypothetical protein
VWRQDEVTVTAVSRPIELGERCVFEDEVDSFEGR